MEQLTFDLEGFKNGHSSYIVFSAQGFQLGTITFALGQYNLYSESTVFTYNDMVQIINFIHQKNLGK